MIHEAQFTPREYATKVGWGHSSMSNAVIFLKLLAVQNWLITHHDPAAEDDDLRLHQQILWQIMQDAGVWAQARLAYDGMVVPL